MNRQQIIAENPPQAFRINSIGDKNQQKTAAQKALETAKKQNRPVRMAKPGESGSFRVEKPSERPGFLDGAAAVKKIGMSKATLDLRRQKGFIAGSMMNRKWFYAEEEVQRFIDSLNQDA